MHERPRATAQEALNPKQYRDQPLTREEVSYVGEQSGRNGLVAAIATGFVSSGAVYLANELSPKFRGALGVSGKMALVVTPTAGAFFLKSHLTVAEARADPDKFVSGKPTGARQTQQQQSSLSLFQTASNFVYFNPFKTIGAIALPLYGYIFHKESTSAATAMLPLSQRLIHTRVYGQMVAVLTTCGVMGFVKSMDAEGPFRIKDGHVVRGVSSHGANAAFYESVGLKPPAPRAGSVKGGAALAAPADGAEAPAKEERAARAARAEQAEARRLQAEREAAEEEAERQGQGYGLLVPLLYAPLVPLMRVGLRGRVSTERLTQLTLGVIGVALAHAGSYMFTDSSVAVRR